MLWIAFATVFLGGALMFSIGLLAARKLPIKPRGVSTEAASTKAISGGDSLNSSKDDIDAMTRALTGEKNAPAVSVQNPNQLAQASGR